MKSLILLFSSFLLVCSADAQGLIKLTGKISNRLADSVSVNYDNGGIVFEPTVVATALTKDGQFSLSFSVKQHFTQVSFYHGNQTTMLVVQPGDDLYLTLDGNNFDSTLHYEGKGKELANFMALDMVEIGGMYDFTRRVYGHLGEDGASFEKSIIAEQKKEEDFYTKNGTGLPTAFASWWKTYYTYSAYQVMLDYPMLHEIQKQHTYSIKGEIPKENYEIVASVPTAFNDAFVDISPYSRYVQGYYYAQLSAAGYNNITNEEGKKYRQDDSLLSLLYHNAPPKTTERVVANFIYMHSEMSPAERNETLLAAYKKHFPTGENIKLLEQRISMLKKLSTGQPAPNFKFKTLEGKEMKLTDLKDQVVLIDFWASWCGPCKAQMPASRKLEEHFKDQKVVFLYISVDDDADKWKEAIKKYDIQGMHTRVDGAWNAEVAKLYGINGVPSYFIVDKNGNFGTRTVPRPDEGDKLQAEIEKLLK